MFFKLFFFLCLTIYLVSIVEVIGSYLLSTKEFGNYSTFYMCIAVSIPPLTPIIASAIYTTANDLYKDSKRNKHQVDESFYGYIIHGFKTINEWSDKYTTIARKAIRKPRRKLCPVINLYHEEY